MGLCDRIESGGFRASVPGPSEDFWYIDRVSQQTLAGYAVNAETANRVSAVNACVNLITEMIASLPCILYRKRSDGGKDRATDHPLYNVLARRPNGRQSRYRFFAYMTRQLALRGNAFADIDSVRGLVPVFPDYVMVEELESGRVRYKVRKPNTPERTVTQDNMLHLVDLGDDPNVGMSRAVLAREAIALAAAGEGHAARFLKNDGSGRVVLSVPGKLNDTARAEFHKNYQENYAGWSNKAKAMLLDNGGKAEILGSLSESGFLVDPRKFQVSDICRFWRVWPFMIGHEDKVTWGTNIEQTKQAYIDFTARPWGTNIEQELMAALLSDEEQEDYVIEFLYDALLRGDTLSRMQAYQLGRNMGVYSPDEIRAMENRNPRPDGKGGTYLETPTGAAPNAKPKPVPVADGGDKDEQARIPAPLLADAAERIAGGEAEQVAKREEKAATDGLKFVSWVREYFGDRKAYVVRVLAPLASAYGLEPWAVEEAARRCERTAVQALTTQGVPFGWCQRRRDEVADIITETFNAPAARRKAA